MKQFRKADVYPVKLISTDEAIEALLPLLGSAITKEMFCLEDGKGGHYFTGRLVVDSDIAFAALRQWDAIQDGTT